MFGICHLSMIPGRKEPSHRSEMVTQILFGETFKIGEETEEWCKIITAFDHYECWISNKQYLPIKEELYLALNTGNLTVSKNLYTELFNETEQCGMPVVMGSVFPAYKNGIVQINNIRFNTAAEVHSFPEKNPAEKIIATAKQFTNAPYLWGGKSVFGIDCSGFVQTVFKVNGIKLKRDAWQQAEDGIPLSFVEEAEPGDIAFFDNEEGKIIHVGIVIENQQIIHASGKVRIDKFDHYGIFHTERKKYSHNLRVIKRILN